MLCDEGCRTAVFGKTERTVGWEGNGDPVMTGLLRHCTRGNPQQTDRPCLPPLNHSFTLDFVIGFQREDDARRVMEVLPKRFAKYGLEIHPEKSRLLAFGKPASDQEVRRGDNTFDYLGFTHYWARSRSGSWVIKRKTARKNVRKTVQALRMWCRTNRHQDLAKQHRILCSKLRGHFQYFGVRCNMRAMEAVLHHAKRGWKFWLNRRSSKKALNWEKFAALLARMPLPTPKIIHTV